MFPSLPSTSVHTFLRSAVIRSAHCNLRSFATRVFSSKASSTASSIKWTSPQDAVSAIRSDENIWIAPASSTPSLLLDALCKHVKEHSLQNLRLFGFLLGFHKDRPAPFLSLPESIRHKSFFVSEALRESVNKGLVDYIPTPLSSVPHLIRRNMLPIDAVLLTVTPPDSHGFCSTGVSVDATLSALQSAKSIIAVVNPHMPRTHGQTRIHISRINALVSSDAPLLEHHPAVADSPNSEFHALVEKIGTFISVQIPDRACLRVGLVGDVPDALLPKLMNHRHLGIHAEVVTDGLIPLLDRGVVDNSCKEIMPGRVVASFALGSQSLYDYLDDNSLFHFDDIAWVADPAIISKNPLTVSVSSCIAIDVTGQSVADSVGTQIFGGIGDELDFVRGSSASDGGMSIIAFPAITRDGHSRILSTLHPGAGIVVTRSAIQHVCTEYGMVNLFGKSLRERAAALISIAHPKYREELDRAAHARFGPLVWPVIFAENP